MASLIKLRYASGNEQKFNEVQQAVPHAELTWLRHSYKDIMSLDPKEIIIQRGKDVFQSFTGCFFIDHFAIYFEEFDFRLPGALTEVYLEHFQTEKLCRMISGNRGAKITCFGLFCNEKKFKIVEETMTGTITQDPDGTLGFGWDAIFIPHGQTLTFAKMNLSKKIAMSPRTKVAQRIVDHWSKGAIL